MCKLMTNITFFFNFKGKRVLSRKMKLGSYLLYLFYVNPQLDNHDKT